MRTISVLAKGILAVAIAVAIVGCDDDDSKAAPVGANVAGSWAGTYYVEGGDSVAITASVGQDGAAVSIRTSKPNPPGRSLTGTITEDGDLSMTDGDDGEIWSNFGRVTDNYIRIGDYTRQPTAEDQIEGNDVPLQIIELTR